MSTVVLVNCKASKHHPLRTPKLENLGLAYLAATLRERNISTDIHDYNISPSAPEQPSGSVADDTLLVGFSVSHFNLQETMRCIRSLRRDGFWCHIVLGGYLPTFLYQEMFRDFNGFDSIIRGEGEYTLLELVECVKDSHDWRGINGLVCRNGHRVIVNPPRSLISDLDELPFPARDTLEELFNSGNPVASVSPSRGCYMNCSFCSIAAFYGMSVGKKWRGRSPERIVDEIEIVLNSGPFEEHKADYIWFCVDEFVGPKVNGKAHAERIAEVILKRGLRPRLEADCRADQVSFPLFSLLKQAGLRRVYLGVESFVQSVLDGFRKGSTVESNVSALRVLGQLGIDYSIGIIMFGPETTFEEFQKNHEVLTRIGYHHLTSPLARLKVFRGTPLEQELVERNDPAIEYKSGVPDLKKPEALDYVYNYNFRDDRVAALWECLYDLDDQSEQIVSEIVNLRLEGLIDGVLFWCLVDVARDSLAGFIGRATDLVAGGHVTESKIALLRERHHDRITESLTEISRLRASAGTRSYRKEKEVIRLNDFEVLCELESNSRRCAEGHEREVVTKSYPLFFADKVRNRNHSCSSS